MNENTNIDQTTQEATSFFDLIVGFFREFIDMFKYIFNDVFLGKNP